MKEFFKNYHGYVSTFLTVVAFVIELLSKSKAATIVALLVYAVGITWLVVAVYRLFSKSMKMRSRDGFCRMAATSIFRTDDGKTGVFEFRRYIQSKSPFLSSVKHDYKWKGNGEPEISSAGRKLEPVKNPDPNEYDHVIVPLGRNLFYNECAVVSVKFEGAYADCCPLFRHKVEELVGPIEFKVMLGHLQNAADAILYRKKIGAKVDNDYEEIRHVPFNPAFRMYDYTFEPEAGYVYKLEWKP